MPDKHPDSVRAIAIAELAKGSSYSRAGRAAKVTGSCVWRWFNEDADFRAAVEAARRPLGDLAEEVGRESMAQLMERITDNGAEESTETLNKVAGVALSGLARLRNAEAAQRQAEVAAAAEDRDAAASLDDVIATLGESIRSNPAMRERIKRLIDESSEGAG